MKQEMPQFLTGSNEYMIFGVDVIHPSPGDKGDSSKSESIAAVINLIISSNKNKEQFDKVIQII